MNRLRQFKDRLMAKIMLKIPALLHIWAKNGEFITHTRTPFVPLTKPISRCRVALVTTGGVHRKDQMPFNMDDSDGDPGFREIPADVSLRDLIITHNYYDHHDAGKDINIVLPVERIRDLVAAGDIQSAGPRHFSFMGHIAGPHIPVLIHDTAPHVASLLKQDRVDLVILTPA